MNANVALLNGPQKDQMAMEIRATMRETRSRGEEVLLKHQFPTYHEYAAALAAKDAVAALETAVNAIIKRHLED